MSTFNEILGTTTAFSQQDLKKRYKLLSAKCHPDKGGSNELFKLIKLAFDKASTGYGEQKYKTVNEQSSEEVEQLKNRIKLLEKELSKEQLSKKAIAQDLKEKQLLISRLEEESQEKDYKILALEKQKSSVQDIEPRTSKIHIFSIILMAVLAATAGFTVSQRLSSETTTYNIITPNSFSQETVQKEQYELFLMALINADSAERVTKDLNNRGYNARISPASGYYKIIVTVQTNNKSDVNTVIDQLRSLTGSQARIITTGI